MTVPSHFWQAIAFFAGTMSLFPDIQWGAGGYLNGFAEALGGGEGEAVAA